MADSPAEAHTTPKTEKPASDSTNINLRVAAQNGGEVFFRIKDTTPLSKLMDAYCDRQSISRQNVRFIFDGHRISDTATPKSLDMEDNDIIDAMLQQTGGF